MDEKIYHKDVKMQDSISFKAKKTQKKKNELSTKDKEKMWQVFEKDNTSLNMNVDPECVYKTTPKDTNICLRCESPLITMEDGFPTCSNNECCLIYKDTLDYSPEWRFFNPEDRRGNDPTRCGNPINPLLVESSFGCKIICNQK